LLNPDSTMLTLKIESFIHWIFTLKEWISQVLRIIKFKWEVWQWTTTVTQKRLAVKIMFFSRSWHNEQLSLTYHLRTFGVKRMTAWLGDIHRKQWLMEAILHKNTLHGRTTIEYDPVSSGLSNLWSYNRICKWVKVSQITQFESATSVKHTWN